MSNLSTLEQKKDPTLMLTRPAENKHGIAATLTTCMYFVRPNLMLHTKNGLKSIMKELYFEIWIFFPKVRF